MILGQLQNVNDERSNLGIALQKGFAFLLSQDVEHLSPGKYEIDANCYASVDEYQTQPKSERRPEAHNEYIDIQYIVRGREIIGHSIHRDDIRVLEQCLEKDVFFFESPAQENDIHLQAGDYAVFFPWDIHRPCCQWNTRASVKKVVVKVKI